MVTAALQLALLGENPLAVLSFGIGIVALLLVLRRTTIRRMRAKNSPADSELDRRSLKAHAAIEEISMREHYRKLSTSPRFDRLAVPGGSHRQLLGQLTEYQARSTRRHG
jgi:hypothetical protein